MHTTSKVSGDHDSIAAQEDQKKRLSAYSFSNLPEVVSWSTHQGKEVATPDGKVVRLDDHKETVDHLERGYRDVGDRPELYNEECGKEEMSIATESSLSQKPHRIKERFTRRICGIRPKCGLLGLALLILLAFSLGIGLGVGLRSK